MNYTKGDKKLTAFQLSEEMYNDLLILSDEYFMSFSGLVRMALVKFIREEKNQELLKQFKEENKEE